MLASTLSVATCLRLLPPTSSLLAKVPLTPSLTTVLPTASVRARPVLTLAVLALPVLPTLTSLLKFILSYNLVETISTVRVYICKKERL